MSFVASPNLPTSRVKCVAVNALYENLAELEGLGIRVVKIPPNPMLDTPVAAHADMNVCHLGCAEILVAKGLDGVFNELISLGFNPRYIKKSLGKKYPDDIALNCAFVGDYAVANFDAVADEIREHCNNKIEAVNVNQGYAKCSTLIVSEKAVITADVSIAAALTKVGFDVLVISSGHIKLSGYNYGFIGGCGGLIDTHTLLFCGDITTHPDYEYIHSFLSKYSVTPLCLSGELTDVGGILPLLQ
ncbi:MAG: hypothetical protein IJF54_04215 [Clostridia bacterium]|nr:hypothetical protein [Clostridia bacterium]